MYCTFLLYGVWIVCLTLPVLIDSDTDRRTKLQSRGASGLTGYMIRMFMPAHEIQHQNSQSVALSTQTIIYVLDLPLSYILGCMWLKYEALKFVFAYASKPLKSNQRRKHRFLVSLNMLSLYDKGNFLSNKSPTIIRIVIDFVCVFFYKKKLLHHQLYFMCPLFLVVTIIQFWQ